MSLVLALAALAAAAASLLASRSRRRWIIAAWGGGAGGDGRRGRPGGAPPGGAGPSARRGGPISRLPSGRLLPFLRGERIVTGPELALLVAEVASRLRSGAPVEQAWEASWTRVIPEIPFTRIEEDGSPGVISRIAGAPSLREARAPSDLVRIRRARSARGRAARSAALSLRTACRLSSTSGAPLARILDAVADGLEESEAAEEARRIASSSARTSSRILMALPLLGILGAQTLGADPIGVFGDGGAGTLLGLVGLILLLAAGLVSRALIGRAGSRAGELDPAIACDLALAVLEAGGSIPQLLEAIGSAAEDPGLLAAGRALRIGVTWSRAWQGRGESPLALALEPAWRDGAAPEELLRRSARGIRSRRMADARARAEALGVTLAIPLGALLLPAFLALGLGPVMLRLFEGGFGALA